MKRFLALALSAVLALSMTACSSDEPSSSAEEPSSSQSEQLTIRVGGLKGPTAMGMVKLMADDAAGTTANDYEFTLAGAATEINPLLIQGELDIAAVPTNVASVLYNNTKGQVEIAALNTLGVLYVVENGDSVQSIADLAGKTVYSTGMGATPEYALNYILEKNGLTPGEDVTVEYLGEHSELAALLAAGEASIAVLPQPFVTSVLNQNPDVRIALDLTEEWDKVTEDGSKLTGNDEGLDLLGDLFIDWNPAGVGKNDIQNLPPCGCAGWYRFSVTSVYTKYTQYKHTVKANQKNFSAAGNRGQPCFV